MMKELLLAVSAFAALAGSAKAADLARPLYARPVAVAAPVYTWTGFYAGGNVGGIWAKSDWSDASLGDFGTNNAASGVLGGLQGGYNYQAGGWVFGFQGDYDRTNINNNNAIPLFPAVSDHTRVLSLASVTGRVGYAWDLFLGYVKAGGAWEQSDFAFQVGGAPVATASATQSGWTVGIGGEYAFLNWLTGFIEYDYYKFGNANPGAVCTPPVCGFATTNVGINTNASVLKAGFNFKFGGSLSAQPH